MTFVPSTCIDKLIDIDSTNSITDEMAVSWWNNIAVGENKTSKNEDGSNVPYFTTKEYFHSNQQLLNEIEHDILDELDSVVEIGAGYGRETSKFAERYKHVYVTDIAEEHINILVESFPTITAKLTNGTTIPFDNNIANLVYSCFVMQHVSKKNAIKLLNESIRVLKKGGVFIHEFLSGQYCGGSGKDHLSEGVNGMFNNGYYKDEIIGIVNNISGIKLLKCVEEIIIANGKESGLGNIWLVCQKTD